MSVAVLRELADEATARRCPNMVRLATAARAAGVPVVHCLAVRRPDDLGSNQQRPPVPRHPEARHPPRAGQRRCGLAPGARSRADRPRASSASTGSARWAAPTSMPCCATSASDDRRRRRVGERRHHQLRDGRRERRATVRAGPRRGGGGAEGLRRRRHRQHALRCWPRSPPPTSCWPSGRRECRSPDLVPGDLTHRHLRWFGDGGHRGGPGSRAADGRVPGRRGRATRQRLLECTADMLGRPAPTATSR